MVGDEVGDSDNAELVEVIIGLSHMIIKCSLAVKHRIKALDILCNLAQKRTDLIPRMANLETIETLMKLL